MRTVLITGGGTGIGRATGLLFAAHGANLMLVRRREPLAATAAEARAGGGGRGAVEWCEADVTSDPQVRAAVAGTVERFGALDVLVNNAGWAPGWTPLHETTDESWTRVLHVNLTGAFRALRAALPHLVASRGSIVNISSISAPKASSRWRPTARPRRRSSRSRAAWPRNTAGRACAATASYGRGWTRP